ncbi:putative phosphodiesterase [Chitinivorax tropicus]|uniref:Putative phosphodiesterase n=1 Tax=Chitinivorax tropicus TaxID=714531 RepID=A0A840MNA2_9PROT|nr:metallophosphoesterase family protein [Chitinivorax tropicus]MBB5020118.1 putative phosphodiesterase [Chitinivorax tropicus]
MRFAVLSDIHGNLPALEAVLADLPRHDITQWVNLGDILSGPLWPAETAARLMSENAVTIRGNHERQLLACAERPGQPSDQYAFDRLSAHQLAWLQSLPSEHWLAPDVLMVHGMPGDDLNYLLEDVAHGGTLVPPEATLEARLGNHAASLVLCGHSHLPRAVWLSRGILLVNPGSVGLQGYDDDAGGPHLVQNYSPHARYAICEQQGGHWHVQQLMVPYDWDAAARQAERNGRPDWAYALRTGRARLPA